MTTHPEFFTTRADGTIAYAENPPKKYQDIYPINFDNDPDGHLPRGAAGRAALDVARRADLPRRQPAHQAGGVLGVAARGGPPHRPRRALPVRGVHPAGDDARRSARSASTRATPTSPGAPPSGRSRTTSARSRSESDHLMRPNFFVNTPDILPRLPAVRRPGGVQDPRRPRGHRVAQLGRLRRLRALRARRGASPGSEEYLDSEKFQIRIRDWDAARRRGPHAGAVPHAAQRDPARSTRRSSCCAT